MNKWLNPTWLPALVLALLVASPLTAQQDQVQEDQEQQATSVAANENSESSEASTAYLFNGDTPTSIDQLQAMQDRVGELAAKLFPATVNIQLGASQGSGVVVTGDGYVLTAAHVIGKPGEVAKIRFPNGDLFDADTLGVSEGRIDSGMLKIRNPDNKRFAHIDLGISEDLNVGQWVIAVGHPGGFDEQRGLVARVGRVVFASDQVIRTDCTLVGGDSGGPLIDMNGDLIGIHSRIGATLADNLHVPVDQYSINWDKLAAGLILSGRPSLGFSVKDDTNEVENVSEDKSAEEAGMEVGDLIVGIEGIPVTSREDISDAINELNLYPNQKIKVTVKRGDEEMELDLVVGQR